MSEWDGKKLGNYVVLRQIGHGGFADVFLGQHTYLMTHAAIKVLQARLSQNDLPVFQAEAQTIANLTHPNIVRVLEFGEEGNIPFLVMDYCPGGSLRQRHQKGARLALGDCVSYVKQVAAALQYAHSMRIIHRDVKPENMLIGKDGAILMSDFGIALISQSSRYQKQDISGTIAYTAPEQLQGKAAFASDQYALGVVAYEWLTGELPFKGSFVEIAGQHVSAPVPSLRAILPQLPEAVDGVVQKALAKDPQQRFRSIQEFAEALEQASQGRMPAALQAIPVSISDSSTLRSRGNSSGDLSTYVKTENRSGTIPMSGERPPLQGNVVYQTNPLMPPPPPPVYPSVKEMHTSSPPYGQQQTSQQPFIPPKERKQSNVGYILVIVLLLVALLGVGTWALQSSLAASTKRGAQGSAGNNSPTQQPAGSQATTGAQDTPASTPTTAAKVPAQDGTFNKNIKLSCGSCNDPITVTITSITVDSATSRMIWNLSLYNTTTSNYSSSYYYFSEFSLQGPTDENKTSASGNAMSPYGSQDSIPAEQKVSERLIFSFIPNKGLDYTLTVKLYAYPVTSVNFDPVTIHFD